MMKSVSALAMIMALSMTAAVAKDLKQDKKATTPAVAAAQMNDSEMDKVTAGFSDNAAQNFCCGTDSLINHSSTSQSFDHAKMPPASANGFRGTGP